MKISYTIEDNYNVPTGIEPTQKILSIDVEGNCNLVDEIIEKFFRMLVKHPEEMEWKG
jgi:hypothetical protein